jgi:hypothetical protein
LPSGTLHAGWASVPFTQQLVSAKSLMQNEHP